MGHPFDTVKVSGAKRFPVKHSHFLHIIKEIISKGNLMTLPDTENAVLHKHALLYVFRDVYIELTLNVNELFIDLVIFLFFSRYN